MEETKRGMTEEARLEYAKWVYAARQMGRTTKNFHKVTGKTIDILAMGPSRGQCPFDAETWGCNTGWKQVLAVGGKLDKLFLAHTQVYSAEGNPYFEWDKMAAQGFEIVTTHRIKDCKSTLFPRKRIEQKFDCAYWSDTICYMIAYALDKYTYIDKKDPLFPYGKVKLGEPLRLRLYGVDMQDYQEYQLEKGGIEHWLGIAKGLGVEYLISFGSTLLTTETGKPYGDKHYNLKDIIPDEWKGQPLYQGGKLLDDALFQKQIYCALSGGLPLDNSSH